MSCQIPASGEGHTKMKLAIYIIRITTLYFYIFHTNIKMLLINITPVHYIILITKFKPIFSHIFTHERSGTV